MANNRVAYGLCKSLGIDTEGLSPQEAWDALKEKGITPENADRKLRDTQTEKYDRAEKVYSTDAKVKTDYESTARKDKKKLAIDTPEAREVYERIASGQYYSAEELAKHPVLKQLDAESERMTQKYGYTHTITTQNRENLRQKIQTDFLSRGAMVKNGDGKYVPEGKVKKEYKMVIAIGLPASGKSTRIANPVSEELGAFVFDSDEVKEMIPEFQESGGAAANAVHKESKAILDRCREEFLTGSKKGDNLVVPIIGDSYEKLQKDWIGKFEAAGYDVSVQYQDANPMESLNRVIMRAIVTGRIIPSETVLKYKNKPKEVYDRLKKEGKYVK